MQQVLDVSNLDMLKSVIGDDLKDILVNFLVLTPELMIKLSEAIKQEDAAEVKHHAHTLKGSAANVGAIELPVLSQKLEHMGRDNQLNGAAELGQQVEQAYQRLATELQVYINNF